MYSLIVPEREMWDEENEVFFNTPAVHLKLEHSLISVSRWESKWKKPFLKSWETMSREERFDYFRCMTVGPDAPESVYFTLSTADILGIVRYIDDPMTATRFSDRDNGRKSRKIITSEQVYSWMIELGIPFDCEKWHFNRLIALIRVCRANRGGEKKMSGAEAAAYRSKLNAARRSKAHSRG